MKLSLATVLVASVVEGKSLRDANTEKIDLIEDKLLVTEAESDHRRMEDEGDGFRLEMYCETKYEWQNRRKCPKWCLTYSKCSPEAYIRIKKCGDSSKERWRKDGAVLRPACDDGRRLCLDGDELNKCDTKISFDYEGKNKFEIRKGNRLLTQHHHPKDGERVGFKSMRKTRKNNTNLWKKA